MLTSIRHPKVIEDEKAVEVILRLEEQKMAASAQPEQGRRMTVTAVGSRLSQDATGRLSIATVRPSIGSVAGIGRMSSVRSANIHQETAAMQTVPEKTEAVDFATR